MSRNPYTYTLLRYVPDPVREEFINIGLLMVMDGRALFAVTTDVARAVAFFPDLSADTMAATVQVIMETFEGADISGVLNAVDCGGRMISSDEVLRWSAMRCGLGDDRLIAFHRAFARNVGDVTSWRKAERELARASQVALASL